MRDEGEGAGGNEREAPQKKILALKKVTRPRTALNPKVAVWLQEW